MIYTQLSDGSVPSFEEFSAIKTDLMKLKSGNGAKASDLKRNEIAEETLQ